MDLSTVKAFFSGEKISYNSALKQFEIDHPLMRSAYQGTLHSKEELSSDSDIASRFLFMIQQKYSTGLEKRWIEESPRIICELEVLASEKILETITRIKQAQFLFKLTHPALTQATPLFLRDDPLFVLKAIKHHPETSQFAFATSRLRSDKSFMLDAILIDPTCARFASDELKTDQEFILALVDLDFRLFYLASETLRKDPDFMKRVILKAPSTIREAHEDLLNDVSFMSECLEKDFRAALYAGHDLKKDPIFMLKAVRQSLLVLKAIDPSLLQNVDFMKKVIEIYPHAASCASETLKANKEFALFVLNKNPKFYEQLSVLLRSDPEVTFFAMQKDRSIFHFAAEELSCDLAFMKKITLELDCFELVPEQIKNLESFCLDILEKKPSLYQSIPRSLQNQIYFNLAACKRHYGVYEFMPSRMQKIPDIILSVIKEYPEAILNAQPIDLYNKDFMINAIIQNPAVVFYISLDWVGDQEIFNVVIYGLATSYGENRFIVSKVNDTVYLEISTKKQDVQAGDYRHLLESDLPEFVLGLSSEHLKCPPDELLERRQQILALILKFKGRVYAKEPYVGAPNNQAHLELFYAQVIHHLSHLQTFFANNPDAIEERLQLIRGMSVCGGGLLADLNQLYHQYCESESHLSIEAKLALWRNKLIRRFIESSAQDANVHLANILQYQLSSYLYEDPIPKDPLADPMDDAELMYLFYDALNVESLVNELKEQIASNESLSDGIIKYIHERMFESKPVPEKIQEELELDLDALNQPISELMGLKEDLFGSLGAFQYSEIVALASAKDPMMLQVPSKKSGSVLSIDLAQEIFSYQKQAKKILDRLYYLKPYTSLSYDKLLHATESQIQISAFLHMPTRAKERLVDAFDEKYRLSDGQYKEEGLALVLLSMGLVESL